MADESIEELLGAYALDAVDEEERRQVEAYLQTNPRARAEVQALREVAAMLAFSSSRPPEGVWNRIAEAIEGTAPQPGPELARVLPMARPSRWRMAVVGGASALVAAAAAVAITVVVVRDDAVDGGRQDAIARAYGEASADPNGRRTELRSEDDALVADAVVTPEGVGFLSAASLPELPEDETYQLWGVYADDDVISLGVMGNRPRIEPFTAGDDVLQLVITREQAGGVVSSTNPALLAGELT